MTGTPTIRGPQSLQSVPTAQVVKKGSSEYSDPGPPSSHSPSEAKLTPCWFVPLHVFWQICASESEPGRLQMICVEFKRKPGTVADVPTRQISWFWP